MYFIIKILKVFLKMKKTGIVFAGHGVSTDWVDRTTEEVHTDISDFCNSIKVLRDIDYEFISMNKLIEISKNRFQHNRHWVHLTFDDGYQNNFDTIYPYLKERNIPFSVFISTHHIGTQEYFPTFWLRAAAYLKLPLETLFPDLTVNPDIARTLFEKKLHYASFEEHKAIMDDVKSLFSHENMQALESFKNDIPLSLEKLKELSSDPLVHIGSHSHHHIIYHKNQNDDIASAEMQTSRDLIKSTWAVEENPTFCFPNGDWSANWIKLSVEKGYSMTFTSASGYVGKRTQPYLMPRFWLSTKNRTLTICALSLLGDLSLKLYGRSRLRNISIVD